MSNVLQAAYDEVVAINRRLQVQIVELQNRNLRLQTEIERLKQLVDSMKLEGLRHV